MHKSESVVENEKHEILRDFEMHTYHLISEWKLKKKKWKRETNTWTLSEN